MTHFSEHSTRLAVETSTPKTLDALVEGVRGLNEVVAIRLPAMPNTSEHANYLVDSGKIVTEAARALGPEATLVVLGEIVDLVRVLDAVDSSVRYQHWVAIRRKTPIDLGSRFITHGHFGMLILTRYKQSLRHTITRIAYTYCPICNRTTKDYGGKKHTYHEGGTALSDVWRDIQVDLDGELEPVYTRLADLFGLEPYKLLRVMDLTEFSLSRAPDKLTFIDFDETPLPDSLANTIINADCLEALEKIPTGSIDSAFTDPPYNLGKGYSGYGDDLQIKDYFDWCDRWITELGRVLKPGRTLALLNIPLWAVRHFLHMQTFLTFQNWIVWDALAYPVRRIMPAHYAILCFSKGESRPLPGFVDNAEAFRPPNAPRTFDTLRLLADDYCLRADCVESRIRSRVDDRMRLTDLWSDIHRLKHNTRRVDHPTQLPPHLMYRLITLFSRPGETVIDCFNGAGTTTLTAHQLGRNYIGIDASEKYCGMAAERHQEVSNGIDPFRKMERTLSSKNSPVPRLKKQIYKISKKTLQLEVKRVASLLGHIPTRDELIGNTEFPIEYYDEYFVSWGEVTAAARTTGMSEKRPNGNVEATQLRLLESQEADQYSSE